MKLDFLDLNDLKISPLNVRKRGDADGTDLIPSIKANGVLQPLLVRKNCDGFEVIAGQRRYHACKAIAQEDEIGPVPCAIMEDGDDAKAIEASLAENFARLPMHELDQYEAFRSLAKTGMSTGDIAAHFGVTERLVNQRLAIAALHAPILNAYARDEIQPSTIRLLTMASPKQQKDWFKLFKAKQEPPPWQLKSWLFGGDEIPTDHALFDLESYPGAIVTDLFDEDRYFADSTVFWEHQSRAIAETKVELEADGWQEVVLLDVGEHWSKWEHQKRGKDKGGKVFIEVKSDGAVTIHEGLIHEKDAKRMERLEQQANGEDAPSLDRPEITKAMQNYLALHRHAAVRTKLLGESGLALRLAVAQMIAGSDLFTVHADPQKANTDAIRQSLEDNNTAQDAFCAECAHIRALLGLDQGLDKDEAGEASASVVPVTRIYGNGHDLHAIFATLLTLDDNVVTRILTYCAAETLPSGSAMIEVLGHHLKVDMADHWVPDDTFFDLLRDKDAINAMIGELAGDDIARSAVAQTAKVQKQVIRKYLSGEQKAKTENWQPRYMVFPMGQYTKRKGIEAVSQWEVVKDRFKTA